MCGYQKILTDMIEFTRNRSTDTPDEIWLLQHCPVYTQGTSCATLPHQNESDIPVVHSDRGGQITYHGPGQLVAYVLVDLKRVGAGPKSFVNRLEQIVIEFLGGYGVHGQRRTGAPGVYVDEAKIAALGLRISRGSTYHGLSININMDMSPYEHIDPCGYHGLQVTQLADHVSDVDISEAAEQLGEILIKYFN